jgi:hypothetical protein
MLIEVKIALFSLYFFLFVFLFLFFQLYLHSLVFSLSVTYLSFSGSFLFFIGHSLYVSLLMCVCVSSFLLHFSFFPLLLQFSHAALFFSFNVHFVQWAVISIAPWRLTNFGKICHTTEILVNHLKNKIFERFLRKLQSFAELQVKMITLKHWKRKKTYHK